MGRGDINANYPPQVPEGDLVGRGDINANYPPQVPEGDLVGRRDINANYPPQVPEGDLSSGAGGHQRQLPATGARDGKGRGPEAPC